jgi:D-alanyl-D-alanine carboxypeptidase (penicillin-binding protein 5/6)
MSSSPFLARSTRRAHTRARRKRRRRRLLTAGAIAIIVAAAAVTLALSRSSVTHGSASASDRGGGHAKSHAPGPSPVAPTRSPAGLALGHPPLHLDLSGADDPVRVAFRHPPRAGLLFDLHSGRVLWQRNPLEHLHIASLTKMMTALRVVRSASPDARVRITKEAVASAGSKVGVLPLGRDVGLKTMLYGLLLPSGNDAAVALAQHVSGNLNTFVDGMNEEAARLGMGCTHYTSPSGYVNARNYSCAADLAELAHVDLEQPLIAHIVRAYKAVLPFPIKGGKLYLYNNNPLLIYHYPGTTGLKTGYTELAGKCLVATAERDGVRLGVVLLDSRNPGTQARQLLDEGFEAVYDVPRPPEPPIPDSE